VRDPVRDGHFRHLHGLLYVLRAVIHPRQDVTVNIHHGKSIAEEFASNNCAKSGRRPLANNPVAAGVLAFENNLGKSGVPAVGDAQAGLAQAEPFADFPGRAMQQ
jgi:hypothetical protein